MMFKISSVLLLALVEIVILAKSKDCEFMIVSTTQSPSQNQPVDDRLAKLEEKVEYYTKVAEANHRIDALELQNKQLQQIINNFTDVRAEVAANMQKLEAIEIHNKQMQMKLENIGSVLMSLEKKSQASYSENIPSNCKEVKERGQNTSGVYRIKPSPTYKSFMARCDMDTREGGWTYILNRFDGSQDFYLNWVDYKNGFGNLSKEFWLGLEHLYQLTGIDNQENELLIELEDEYEDEEKFYAHYSSFRIGNESEGYKLKTLGTYSGNVDDSLSYHVGMKFSTKDKDQDLYRENCAILRSGAWWYKRCFTCHLTGRYNTGTYWSDHQGLRQVRMMTRPKK